MASCSPRAPRAGGGLLAALIATGLAFFVFAGRGLQPVVSNWMVTAKVGLTLVVVGILTYVHTAVQPQIMALLERAGQEDVGARIWSLRKLRRRLSATCLFLVITVVLLGVRLAVPFSPAVLVVFLVLAAAFAWRAFSVPVPFGFV